MISPLTEGQSQFVPSCVTILLTATFVAGKFVDEAVTVKLVDAVCPGPPRLKVTVLVGENTICASAVSG